MSETITIQRSGEFILRVNGDNHCGILPDPAFPTKYFVCVKCDVNLDKSGFLFDQMTIKNYFDSHKGTTDSCELLTIATAHDLMELIKAENAEVKVQYVSVELEPFPYGARMKYEKEVRA